MLLWTAVGLKKEGIGMKERPMFENMYFTFFRFKKDMTFYVFKMTNKKVVKSLKQKFSPQSVEMSSHTSLSDHCNSVPCSPSV